MYDTVYYDQPLPDGKVIPRREFQTKHLGQSHNGFRITDDGRLLRIVERDVTGTGGVTRQESPEKEVPAHMELLLYGLTETGEFAEYIARFTDGRLTFLRPRRELPEIGDWLLSLLP